MRRNPPSLYQLCQFPSAAVPFGATVVTFNVPNAMGAQMQPSQPGSAPCRAQPTKVLP